MPWTKGQAKAKPKAQAPTFEKTPAAELGICLDVSKTTYFVTCGGVHKSHEISNPRVFGVDFEGTISRVAPIPLKSGVATCTKNVWILP